MQIYSDKHVVVERVIGSSTASASNQTRSVTQGTSLSPPFYHLMVLQWQAGLKRYRCSDRVNNTLLSSRKKYRTIYTRIWKMFSSWCRERGVSRPSVPTVLETFKTKYKKVYFWFTMLAGPFGDKVHVQEGEGHSPEGKNLSPWDFSKVLDA